MDETFFHEIHLPQQKKLINGAFFPILLSPNANSPTTTTLHELTQAMNAHKPWLHDLIDRSGALLLRGFPVHSPSDFNAVIEATGFPPMGYVGGGALRTHVVSRVYTANESPPDQNIAFHHEMAYATEYPSKLILFCEVAPVDGGETPLVLSHIIYQKMNQSHPDFVSRLHQHGLIYTRLMAKADDPTSPAGRGWVSTFSTHDKTIAQQRAAKVGMKLEWVDEDGADAVKIVIGPKPAFGVDKARGTKTWFNSIVVAHGGPDEQKSRGVRVEPEPEPEPVTFGDGEPLPAHVVYDCIRILEEECVAVPWKKGDVLIIDNLAVLHSRRPIGTSMASARRVLASLCK